MASRVFIDGYNVIKQHRAWRVLPLEAARARLVAAIAGVRWPVPVGFVEIIFDGASGEGGGAQRGAVRATFAADADAAIRRAIQDSPDPRTLLIISDDREILHTAAANGAARRSVAWLFDRLAVSPPAADAPADDRRLSDAQRRRINDELAARWKLGDRRRPA